MQDQTGSSRRAGHGTQTKEAERRLRAGVDGQTTSASRANERVRQRTEEKILDAALEAIARYGIAKVGMGDVSSFAGVSRGTVYRYFDGCDALLTELGRREAERFEKQLWQTLTNTPENERLAAVIDLVARIAREHPLLQRLPETDPALVLTGLRSRYADLRRMFSALLGPLFATSIPVREGLVEADDLVDWLIRILVSSFLIPDDDLSARAKRVNAMFAAFANPVAVSPDGFNSSPQEAS